MAQENGKTLTLVYFGPLSSRERVLKDFSEFLRQICPRPFLYSMAGDKLRVV